MTAASLLVLVTSNHMILLEYLKTFEIALVQLRLFSENLQFSDLVCWSPWRQFKNRLVLKFASLNFVCNMNLIT